MNESETRAEHIDPALKAAGWGVVDGSRILREYHITPGRIEGGGRKGKAEIADYILVYKNTKLAVVEAKAWGKPLTEGVAQAKSYAGKLEIRFTYATNGEGIYEMDMAPHDSPDSHSSHPTERDIPDYPTPEDALVRIDPASIRKKGKVPKNGSIFFTIFQTFMSGDGETPYFGEYAEDFSTSS